MGWLGKGCLKRTTETLIMAAKEQATRTNNIKAKFLKTPPPPNPPPPPPPPPEKKKK